MPRVLHLIGVAHTIPNQDHSICAFTTKVLLFPEIIKPFGWYVVEYSNEGSESRAHEHVVMLHRDRFAELSRRRSKLDSHTLDLDNAGLGDAFQRRLVHELERRVRPGDIVGHVWGPNLGAVEAASACRHVELSVGYGASPGLPFRIFESSAWMHFHYAKAGQDDGNHYKWVIPSGFDEDKWTPAPRPGSYALFLGRVTPRKGIDILVEIARRMPNLPILAHGPGDCTPWQQDCPPNLTFAGPLHGDERVEIVRNARCMLMPTSYIEPFGFSGIEAQLCGVPLLTTSFGAFQETVIDGLTGFRCHTLADWVEAIGWADRLDRAAIARSARERYSRSAVGRQYDWALRQIADLDHGGWYAPTSRKFEALRKARTTSRERPKLWLLIPYFGPLPNYFQLYLDSLHRNRDCLRVLLLTDNDLATYRVPPNLVRIPATLPALREQIAHFLEAEFGVRIQPDELVPHPYKLVDFKILYPELFRDLGARHGVKRTDYVGWADLDVVYGRVSEFLALDDGYDVIGGFHGHLTALRNTRAFRRLFTRVAGLLDLLRSPEIHAVDEIAFRQPLLRFLERSGATLFYANRYFCDLVPPCFVGRFRDDVVAPERCFFDAYHPHDDIREIRLLPDGRVVVVLEDGNDREVLYCHFQKRPMTLDLDGPGDTIIATSDAFRRT